MRIKKNPPLYKKVASSILERIYNKEFKDSILPSEESLSESTMTSKHTVREALAELSSLSYISRRHGHGNIILNSVVDTKFRIDANMNLLNILEQAGYETKIEFKNLRKEEKNFDNIIDREFYVYDEVITGNDVVASYHNIYIPTNLIENMEELDEHLKNNQDLFEVLASYRIYSHHSIVEFIPELPVDTINKLFSLKPNTPINTWDEYIHDEKDKLVAITKIRFNPNIFKLRMIRKNFKD